MPHTTRSSRPTWPGMLVCLFIWLTNVGCPKSTDGAGDGGVEVPPATPTEPASSVDGGSPVGPSGQVPGTCSKPEDCTLEGACPLDAMAGCTCVALPEGRACLARCFNAKECPQTLGGALACSAAGLCIPADQITLDAGPQTRPPLSDARRASDASADADATLDVQ